MKLSPISDRAIYDIALGIESLEDIASREGLTTSEMRELLADPKIRLTLDGLRKELEERGVTFSAKCRVLADELLLEVYESARDPTERLDRKTALLEKLVDWANLKPRTDEQQGPSLPQVVINIGESGTSISLESNTIKGSAMRLSDDRPSYLPHTPMAMNPLSALPLEAERAE